MRLSRSIKRGLVIGFGVIPMIVIATQVTDAKGGPVSGRSRTGSHFNGPGVINHPVDIVPSDSVRIPNDWPVGADGSINCYTCHEQVPKQNDLDPQLRGAGGAMIDYAAFCMSCHTNDHERTASTMHWMGVGKAHIRKNQRTARLASFGGLDSDSKQCLSCHDAITGMDSSASSVGHGMSGAFSSKKSNHPIGMNYPPRRHERYQSTYRPTMMLPPQVQLPGGKVSCVSCHNLYSQSPKLLSVTSEGSNLCFSCHDM